MKITIPLTRALPVAASLAAVWLAPAARAQPADAPSVGGMPMAQGPFNGTLDALDAYRCPEWFRDAKLGIWSHWGPQSVPMQGDWYARRMYEEGSDVYRHHAQAYGHPSKFGYKDIIPLWKGEKFEPERLAALYTRAGAKYLVCAAVHFDNFDLWNSKHQPWNSVAMGAKRDVVGEWKSAAQKNGMRFGVSEHLAPSFTWYQPSHGADKQGPFAGVPYDGADPRFHDLYHRPAVAGDGWLTGDLDFQAQWARRIRDLLDQHQPDLLFSDSPLPFGALGTSLVSHFYNSSLQAHGEVQAVYVCRELSGRRWVHRLDEVPAAPLAEPWQTAISISDWYYRRGMAYKSAGEVIHLLCDVASKNGSLLVNVPHRADGSLDAQAHALLEELAAWNGLAGEAIHATRPWAASGERGSIPLGANGSTQPHDVRYTRRGDTLYAILLGWPGRLAVLRALSLGSPLAQGERPSVYLLGDALGPENSLLWRRTEAGLAVELPPQPPGKHAFVLKVTGLKLAPVPPEAASQWQVRLATPGKTAWPDEAGTISLSPDQAELHGPPGPNGPMRVQDEGEKRNIGYWDSPSNFVTWDRIEVAEPGTYRVVVRAATIHPRAGFTVEVAGQQLRGEVMQTKDWYDFQPFDFGTVEIKDEGPISLTIRNSSPEAWRSIDIQSIRLIRQEP